MESFAPGYARLIKSRQTPQAVDDMVRRALIWKLSEAEQARLEELAKQRKWELSSTLWGESL
jgi:hypothetical protein